MVRTSDVKTWIMPHYQTIAGYIRENMDVLLITSIATAIFFYNLDGWMMMTVEEWQFYRNFTTDWFASKRIHSFFVPTYILAWFVPSRDFIVLRYFTAGLSVLGVTIFHLTIRRASKSKWVAGAASLLIVTDAWLLWFGRQFTWFWSAITISAIMFYIFVRWRERSLYGTSILGAFSILNFSQAIFFVVPFLASQLYSLRETVSRKHVVAAAVLFLLLVSPSTLLFLEKQEHHLALQKDVARSDGFIQVPLSVSAPVVGQQKLVWTIDPFNTFKQLTWRIGIPSGGLHNFSWSPLEKTVYAGMALLLLLFPILMWRSPWEYGRFFSIGAITVFVFLIVFPFLTDDNYLWAFALFLYPLLTYGLVKGEGLSIRVVALVLVASLVTFQGITAYQYMLSPEYSSVLNNSIGQDIAGEDIIVTERAAAMLTHSNILLLENAAGYAIVPCDQITNMSRPVLTTDACVRLQESRELVHNPKALNLYR